MLAYPISSPPSRSVPLVPSPTSTSYHSTSVVLIYLPKLAATLLPCAKYSSTTSNSASRLTACPTTLCLWLTSATTTLPHTLHVTLLTSVPLPTSTICSYLFTLHSSLFSTLPLHVSLTLLFSTSISLLAFSR